MAVICIIREIHDVLKPEISDILKATTELLLVTEVSHHKIYRLFSADPTASKLLINRGKTSKEAHTCFNFSFLRIW